MKTILQTLYFFLLVTQICFAQWMQLGLGDNVIKDIAARNSNIFVITSDRAVYHSSDNGISWIQIVEVGAIDIAISPTGSVFMLRCDQWGVPLYKSSDNGNTWINLNLLAQLTPSFNWLTNISVSPEGYVYCGANMFFDPEYWQTILAMSTNDGTTWSSPGLEIVGGKLFDFRGQCTITSGYKSIEGDYSSYIYSSPDGGQTWLEECNDPLNLALNVLSKCSNGKMILGGCWCPLFLCDDTCGAFTQVSKFIPETGLSIDCGGSLIGAEGLGVIKFSDDGDSLGTCNIGLTNLNVHTISMCNGGYVYAGTDNGIWRRPLSEIVSVKEEKLIETPTGFLLSQNYPNPFNPSTKIKYSIPNVIAIRQMPEKQSTIITLKVFDILGNEIEKLVNEVKPAGTYEITWNAAALPSGVYFYQLKAGEYVNTKKMILLK